MLWPVRPRPQEDELLSSWLVRLAWANGQKVQNFCFKNWGRSTSIWGKDLDRISDPRVSAVIVERTGVSAKCVANTTLQAYAGTLFESLSVHGRTDWILPIGVRATRRTKFGLQYCSECLRTELIPHYCRRWRLALSVVCPKHHCYLQDQCPNCGAPITPHRCGVRTWRALDNLDMRHCSECKLSLCQPGPISSSPSSNLVAFQSQLFDALREGWTYFAGRPMLSLAYFRGLRALCVFLTWHRHADRLIDFLVEHGVAPAPLFWFHSERRKFEYLCLSSRLALLQMAAWLLSSWPANFILACRQANVTSSYIIEAIREPPFWLWEGAHLNLNKAWHKTTDEEVIVVAERLHRQQTTVYRGDIAQELGISWPRKEAIASVRYLLRS